MKWTIGYDEDLQVIILNFNGECAGDDFYDTTRAHIALYEETMCPRLVIDALALRVMESTTSQLYDIVTEMYEKSGDRDDWMIAIVSPESQTARDTEYFFRQLCKARGWAIESFPTRKAAVSWLLQKA